MSVLHVEEGNLNFLKDRTAGITGTHTAERWAAPLVPAEHPPQPAGTCLPPSGRPSRPSHLLLLPFLTANQIAIVSLSE